MQPSGKDIGKLIVNFSIIAVSAVTATGGKYYVNSIPPLAFFLALMSLQFLILSIVILPETFSVLDDISIQKKRKKRLK